MAVYERVSIGSLAQGAVPPGYTFTRSTAALYVDSDGLLKWSAHNLVLRSEDFSHANWMSGVSPTVVADASIAPDGTLTGDTLTVDLTHYGRQFLVGMTTGAVYTASVWVKASASGSAASFRLTTNNTAAWNTGGSTKVTLTSSWQRVSVTWTQTTNTSAYIILGNLTEAGATDATCYGNVDLWGAQLNYGSTATAYLPTTSAARYDSPRRQWDATNRRWGYVGEGSRTNLLLRSQEFDNAAWVLASGVKAFGSGSAVNATSSPDGSTTMDFICEDTSTGNHEIRQAISVTSGTTYCTSVFAKYGGRYLQIVYSSAQFGASQYATFDLQNGVVSGSAVGTASIDAVGGGVYRCSFAAPATATAGSNVYITISNAATGRGPTYTGDGSSGVYIWGAQLEAGPAPSSYIPTTTIALSRGADLQARALTGPEGTALSTQGTMVVEFSFLGGGSTVDQGSRTALEINNATTAERIRLYNLSGTPTVHVVDGGANQSFQSVAGSPTVNAGVITRVGVAWAFNDVSICVDGSAVATDATATMPTVTTIGIGGYPSSNTQPLFGLIYGWTIYDDAKTDAELQALTTPTTNRNQSRLTLGLGLGL